MADDTTQDELDARFAAYTPAGEEAPPEQVEPTVEEIEQAAQEADDADAQIAAAEAAAQEPPEVDEKAALEERLQRQYFENREAKRREKLKDQELAVLRGTRTETRDETVAREAQQLATQLAADNAFNAQCNQIAKQIEKEFGSFQPVVEKFRGTFGDDLVPKSLLEAVIEAGEGSEPKVLKWLSDNLDEAERISGLSPAKQGVAVAKIAAKLTAPKAASKAPPPIRPVGGGGKAASGPAKDFAKMTTAEQIHFFDEEDRKAREKRYH